MSHKTDFMRLALEQAQQAFSCNEVPVGAVIVSEGKVLSSSFNKNLTTQDPTAHAEILVLREASKIKGSQRLEDCDLYVTLEPCAMCAAAISYARIRRVYYGAADTKFGAIENGMKIFNATSAYFRPEVYSGFYEAESKKLLQDFFKKLR